MKIRQLFLFGAFMILTYSSCAQKIERQNTKSVKTKKDLSKFNQATFASGCFWHEEAVFESVKGVEEAISGYAGGKTANPTYESIETGNTGHAETVNVYYDPSKISYETLVKIYFGSQDPTAVNGQSPDFGTQYRSIIFYRNDEEKSTVNKYINQLNASRKYSKPIAAEVMPFTKFWAAEDYHQDYIMHNPDGGYVQHVSIPEIKEFQKHFPELIKPGKTY